MCSKSLSAQPTHFVIPLFLQFQSSGVAAIWTFWIYPGAAEPEGAAKVGLKSTL